MAGLLGPMMGQQMGVRLGLLGAPEEEQTPDPRFWQGGDKFTGRDGLAGLLAIIGDVAAQQSGGQGNAIEGLLGGRSKALDEFKKRAVQERKMQQTMALIQQAYPNLTPAQQQAMAAGVGDYADFKPPEPDEFDRNAQRAGIAPGSPEYVQAAKTRVLGDPVLSGVNLPSGGQFFGRLSELKDYTKGGATGGLTPMTPDEIKALGLPEGGPGGNRPGRFPVR